MEHNSGARPDGEREGPRADCPTWLNADAVRVATEVVAGLMAVNAEMEPLVRRLIELVDRRYALVESAWHGWDDEMPTEATGYGEKVSGIEHGSALLHLLGAYLFERNGGGIFADQVPPLLARFGIRTNVEVA